MRALRQAIVGESGNDMNFDNLDAKEIGPAGILAVARTMPMFGDKRLVQVRNVEVLKAEQLRTMVPYVENPAPFTTLLFHAAKTDQRIKLFATIKKFGVFAKFDPLKERHVARWISEFANEKHISLLPGASQRIADAIGTSKDQLADALDRLELFVGPGREISPEHVELVLSQTRERSIF